MSASGNHEDIRSGRLLPEKWSYAPIVFWNQNKLTALIFLVVNFLFGTVGIWLPLINALFGVRSFCEELRGLFDSGALYLYSIAFLAAIAGTTFTSLARDQVQHSRSMKTVLAGCSVVSIFLCTIFLQIQLSVRNADSTQWWVFCVNYAAQLIFSVFAVLVALYVHSLLIIEETGSPKSDIDKAAEQMLDQAYDVVSPISKKDFES